MKIGMRDLNAITLLQLSEAFIHTASNHFDKKLSIVQDDDMEKINIRLKRIYSELHKYNNKIDDDSDKTIRPETQADVGDFMVMIIATIEEGFKNMKKTKKMLRNLGFTTEEKESEIKNS